MILIIMSVLMFLASILVAPSGKDVGASAAQVGFGITSLFILLMHLALNTLKK